MLDLYEIDETTLAILYKNDNQTKILNTNGTIVTNMKIKSIIKNSCLFYGSSLDGKLDYSKSILNSSVKLPIVIDEIQNIIFFPVKSIRFDDCSWISFNHIERYIRNNDKTTIVFKCGKVINLDISYNIIDNQVTRCIKLEREMKKRRKK